jgi:hypothetical protein
VPITPAHAAAAWPLHRAAKRLPLAALVIGTFAPDLEYVLRLRPVGKFGHSPVGLVLFCIPITLLVFWAWRALVRPALAPLLPPGIAARLLAPEPGRHTDVVPLAIVAALLGATTHVFWDGFTHGPGWGVALVPVLGQPSPVPGFAWFSLAQYASSVVGSLVIALWAALTLRDIPPDERRFAPGQGRRFAAMAIFVAAVTAVVGVGNAAIGTHTLAMLGRLAIGCELGFAVGLLAYALYAAARFRSRAVAIVPSDSTYDIS